MEISTYEVWLEEERRIQQQMALSHPEVIQLWLDDQHMLEQERSELLGRFPYAAVAKGLYPEHDYACRWCWQNIGSENGLCTAWSSEYPACPLVLATEYIA